MANDTSVAIRVDWRGATVYMTRSAIQLLIQQLQNISNADPKECFEVHIGSLFSTMDAEGNLTMPHVGYADGLSAMKPIIGIDPEGDA